MKSTRFLINVAITVCVVTVFFVVSSVLNLMASTESTKEHAFSFVRRTANKHYEDKEYDSAARYFKQLAESDPLNSGAQIMYAHCLSLQIVNRLQRISLDNSSEQNDRLESDAKVLVKEAIDAYEDYLQFKELRNSARFQLSLLNGFLGDQETSVDYLLMALEDGGRFNEIRARFNTYRCSAVLSDDRIRDFFSSNLRR